MTKFRYSFTASLLIAMLWSYISQRFSGALAASIHHSSRSDVGAVFSSKKILLPVLVSIEGNIGAGKTTLLEILREKNQHWKVIDEPVDTWSTIANEQGESILEVFYKDRRRWSYTFQNCALLTRHQNIETSIRDARTNGLVGAQVFLTERCLDTDYNVFTRMLRDEGSIDKLEIDLYERLLNQLRSTSTELSAIVHVDTDPTICYDRIKYRARKGEEAIPLDYLKAVDNHQRKWVATTPLPNIATDLSNVEEVEQFINKLVFETNSGLDLNMQQQPQQPQQQQRGGPGTTYDGCL